MSSVQTGALRDHTTASNKVRMKHWLNGLLSVCGLQLVRKSTIEGFAGKRRSCGDRSRSRDQLLEAVVPLIPTEGDLVEFGVFKGAVTWFLRPRFPNRYSHAFDSWKGVRR